MINTAFTFLTNIDVWWKKPEETSTNKKSDRRIFILEATDTSNDCNCKKVRSYHQSSTALKLIMSSYNR